jgi:hypothetical protein
MVPRFEVLEARLALAADVFEPNDSFSEAVDITQGNQIWSGLTIESGNDDWFKWTAGSEGRLDIDIDFVHSAGDLDLELYDSGQIRLAASESSSNDERISFPVVAGQSYFVRVFGFLGQTNTYDLSVAGPSQGPSSGTLNDRFEPNPDRSRATSLGTGDQVQAGLLLSGIADEDWFAWTASASGNTTVSARFGSAGGGVSLEVFDANGFLLGSSTSAFGEVAVTVNVFAKQKLFMRVFGTSQNVIPYDLLIDSPGAAPAPTPGARLTLLSVNDTSKLGAVAVEPGDIVAFDGSKFEVFFDGSDVGATGLAIDGLDFTDTRELLLTFSEPVNLPGIAQTVDDSDVVRFIPSSFGDVTSGFFEMYFDGSDVGLTELGEDITGISLLADGRLLVATRLGAVVPGLQVGAEDVLAFSPRSLGEQTLGDWNLYLDGSDIGLQTSPIDALALDSSGQIHLSTDTDISLNNLVSRDEDVFVFVPSSLGENTFGTFQSTLTFDGSLYGMSLGDVIGVDVDVSTVAPAVIVSPTSGLETSESGAAAHFEIVSLLSKDVSEGVVLEAELIFTPADWNIPRRVNVVGVDDSRADGDVSYTIQVLPAVSFDADYNGFDASDVAVLNRDNDAGPVLPGADILVTSEPNLVTNEDGRTATFKVVLARKPTAGVSIPVRSSDTTEGIPLTTLLTFNKTNWNVPQAVTVRGVDDSVADGNVGYKIVVGPAQSEDPSYNGIDPSDVPLTNQDNDAGDPGQGPAGAIYVGIPSSTRGLLDSGSDVDWFSFDAQSGSTYVVETVLDTLRDSTLALYAPNGTTQLAFDDDSGVGFASRIEWTAPASGRYFVQVAAFRRETGSYSLAVSRQDFVPPAPPPPVDGRQFLSVRTASVVGGIQVQDEDIVAFDGSTFSIWFDGSDVGLQQQRIDAFDVISSNEILLSFTDEFSLPGIDMPIADSDIVRFVATSLGPSTKGDFELFFDGSDVGLSPISEDIKGIKLLSDGRLLITTNFQADVPSLLAENEDILAFTPTSLGANTAGAWSVYFDGSDVNLGFADLDAIAVDRAGNIYLSIGDDGTVSGLAVRDEDIFIFQPTLLGEKTLGNFASVVAFDGSLWGIDDDVFGFALNS